MPRKRTESKLIEINKPDPTALPLEIGLNLPCMKGEVEDALLPKTSPLSCDTKHPRRQQKTSNKKAPRKS